MAREGADGLIHPKPGDPMNPPGGLRPRGMASQHLVPNPREGQGTERTPRGHNLHIGLQNLGAHAWLKWRHLITAPQTARRQVVRLSVPRPAPVGGPRAVSLTNRPALQLPQYRFTGKPDKEVYAEAKARAAARLATRKRGR